MIERFLVSLVPAGALLAVIVYSVRRARRESAALVDHAIARSKIQTAAILEGWRLKAAATSAAQPDEEPSAEAIEPPLMPVREAFGALLRDDDWAFLRQALGSGRAVEDAGRALGLTPEQARARLADSLRRLCAFAEVAEAQGFATGAAPAT